MKLRYQNSWMSAGLAALILMAVGDGSRATAGIVVTKANSAEINDPQYEYLLQITALAGTATGDYITIGNMVGISPGYPTYSGAGTTISGWSITSVITDSVTFTYNGSTTFGMDTTYALGAFYAGPTIDFSDSTPPPTPTLTYASYNSNGVLLGSGTVIVTYQGAIVPEPSSAIMLSAGCVAVALAGYVRGRARNRRTAI